MKQFLFFTLFSLLSINLQADEPDPLSFFPHQVGDTWIYSHYHGGISKTTVTKDSIDEFGNIFIWRSGFPFTMIDTDYYVHIEPNELKRRDYKLDAKKGETWTVRPADTVKKLPRIEAYVDAVYETIILGKLVTVKRIAYFNLYNGDTTIESSNALYTHTQWLASGIGVIQEIGEGSSEMEFILTGCIINGDTLGIVTGVEENTSAKFSVQLFPNPCISSTTLRCTLPIGVTRGQIEVIDTFGRTIHATDFQTTNYTLNTSASL